MEYHDRNDYDFESLFAATKLLDSVKRQITQVQGDSGGPWVLCQLYCATNSCDQTKTYNWFKLIGLTSRTVRLEKDKNHYIESDYHAFAAPLSALYREKGSETKAETADRMAEAF